MNKFFPLALTATATLCAAKNQTCAPTPPATCYATPACGCSYCLGPVKKQGNAPVHPYTCNGDFVVSVSGFYWNSHQDGMAYGIRNDVSVQDPNNDPQNQQNNNLIHAKILNPDFKWDFGFKVGVGYNTTCDGWDVGVLWTWYRGKASSHDEAEADDNQTLLAIWTNFNGRAGITPFARDIETNWKVQFNLVDIDLGRDYWTSKYLSLRPHVGFRIAWIKQDYNLVYQGGSWEPINNIAFNDYVELDNNFRGIGLRGGLDLTWHVWCGWSLYSDLSTSIIYGRFDVDHDEFLRQADSPFSKIKLLETKNHFRSSRSMLDLMLGVQWAGLVCNCKYRIATKLGWEQHLFFHQNQMWRVTREGGSGIALPNNTGQNAYFSRRGTLDTQGWTLTVEFDF